MAAGKRKSEARSLRPKAGTGDGPITPNDNDPADVPPATVGPNVAVPGDAHGVEVVGESGTWIPPTIRPSAWSGWPADWNTPNWNGHTEALTDTAWTCLDLNSSVLATMPPYLVGASESTPASWMVNPDVDLYASWEEFAKQLFWDYQMGEAFVLATAYYANGWPARFHVIEPWMVEVEWVGGFRRYAVGQVDVTADLLHVRYKSTTSDARGHGPLEAGRARLVAAGVLARYASNLASSGGIPASILTHPDELTAEAATMLQAQWVDARMSSLGLPAVLSGGVEWKATQLDPVQMALVELSQLNEAHIAVMLGVPPFLVGLPSGGDSMTYSNVSSIFDYHWRAGLRPKAAAVMAALSGWLLPWGTRVEVNRDEYVQPEPLVRAQTAQIYNAIKDELGRPAMSVDEIRAAERLDNSTPADVSAGVLK